MTEIPKKQIELWIKEGISFTAGYMAIVFNKTTNLTYPRYFVTKQDYLNEKFSPAEKVVSSHDLSIKTT